MAGFLWGAGMTVAMSVIFAVVSASIFIYAVPLFPEANTAADTVQDGLNHIYELVSNPQSAIQEIPSDIENNPVELLTGKITKIVHGYALDIDDVHIRLALVTTPDIGEPGYLQAAQFVRSNCPIGSVATYDTDSRQQFDAKGRTIAKVWCFGHSEDSPQPSLNALLVSEGHAEILCQFASKSEFANDSWVKTRC